MRIDKSQISGVQFMFTITFFLQSSALLTSFLAGVTKQDSWIAVILCVLFCIPFVILYKTIMVQFPDKNFIQILEEVYGVVLGKFIGILYVWFFLTLTALNLSDFGEFVQTTVMPYTPTVVLTLIGILVVAFGVRHGLQVVTRYGAFFTVVEFIIVFLTVILLYNQIKFEHLLPVFTLSPIKYIQSTHIIATIPFGEVVVFLMITPNVKMSPKDATKYWFGGVGMGMATLLIILFRDISILGNTLPMFTLPGLVSLRLVNIGEALSRMEILFAVGLIMMLFFKISLLCYVTTISIAQIINAKTFKHFVLVVGVLTVTYASTLYSGVIQHNESARETVPILWSFFELIIPFLTFIIAKFRKLPKKSNQNLTTKQGA